MAQVSNSFNEVKTRSTEKDNSLTVTGRQPSKSDDLSFQVARGVKFEAMTN